MERARTSWPVQRRLSFQYRYDVQEQSGSVVLAGFGLELTKKPLDLLDESFERSDDNSAPVSLVRQDRLSTVGKFFSRLKRRSSSSSSRAGKSFHHHEPIDSRTVRLPPVRSGSKQRRPLPSFHSRPPSFTPVELAFA